jgi:hypothetical protein
MPDPGVPTRSPLRAEVTTQITASLATHVAAVNPHAQYALSVDMTTLLALKASISALAAIAFSGNAADLLGTLPTSVLPPLAINDVFVVGGQAAMLALTAQRGDMAIRTDVRETFVLGSDTPGTLADWKEVLAAGQVTTVNGQTGVVVITKASVGLGQVDNTADVDKALSTAAIAALAGKADVVHVHAITDVTGLTAALAGKAATVHTHVISDVTGLQPALDAKAALVHGHVIADVTGLQTALNGKIAASLVDAKGDLLTATADDTPARLAVGSAGQVLTATPAAATGLAWASPSGGGEQESYGPVGSGLDEWTCDPAMCSAHYPTNNGLLILVRHRFRKAMTIDEVGFVLWQAASGPGAYSGVAVYEDGTGVVNKQGESPDAGASYTSVGPKSIALTSGVTVAANTFRWIGYLWTGSAAPHLFSPPGPDGESMMNVGRRRTCFITGQSAFPSTLDVSSMNINTTPYWFSFKDNP